MYVANVEATVKFYEEAFGFMRKFVTPEEDYGELISGETTIAFAHLDLATSNLSKGYQQVNNEKPFGIELGFVVEDVVKAIEQVVQAGGRLYEEQKVKPWGQTVGYVLDNNGFLIELCTAM
ncbi:VOC family protein [Myroides marinus]|nr:VOC family protein [Myroides marinus]MDM1348317.1 VOC family protein [Myroides marinus]MDM1351852.1 VOC family protein [Myroides marinus]MDM1355419.1 VOC family protein [Myroides marinus]MDM1359036.1 VOC family protein [Myroides marinus]MDM1366837.1 VOC family protein [Myroides marinus]